MDGSTQDIAPATSLPATVEKPKTVFKSFKRENEAIAKAKAEAKAAKAEALRERRVALMNKAREAKIKKQEERKKLSVELAAEVAVAKAVSEKESKTLSKFLNSADLADNVRRAILSVFDKLGGEAGLMQWIEENPDRNKGIYYEKILNPHIKSLSDAGKNTGPSVHVHFRGLYEQPVNITTVEISKSMDNEE